MNKPGGFVSIELQIIFDLLVFLAGAFMSLYLKNVSDSIKELRQGDKALTEEINDLRVSLPTNYPSKADVQTLRQEMLTGFDRLFNKIDALVSGGNHAGNGKQ
jgi:hypothetical protein